jgi:hypothetical protein
LPGGGDREAGLAANLLPVLLHDIAGNAQYAASLSGMLAEGFAWTDKLAASVDEFRRDVHEQGYLLGLLGAELGANLLRARREPRSLGPLFRLVRRALRRQERDLAPPPESLPPGGLPRVNSPGEGEGWELAWALATWLLEGGLARPPGSSLSWALVPARAGWTLSVNALIDSSSDGSSEARMRRAQARIEGRLRAIRLASIQFAYGGGAASLQLPPEWLSPDS